MKKKLFSTAALVCGCFLVCLAVIADLSGNWSGVLNLPNGGDYPVNYTFKVDGDKLTGSANSEQGSLPLDSGKITGADFSFSLDFNGTLIKHTGKFYGDSCGLDVYFQGNKIHTTLKRATK